MNTTTLNMTTLDGGNVIIKKGEGGGSTPTPPSGGESASTIEYLDMTNVPTGESWMLHLFQVSLFVKQQITLGGATANTVFPTFLSYSMRGDLLGVNQFAIDFKATIALGRDGMVQTMTVADYIIQQGATQEKLDAIPRITKEEFYNLD